MEKLKLIPIKGVVGCYARDEAGRHYGTCSVQNSRGKQCLRCNSWVSSGWIQGKTNKFYCSDCVVILDAETMPPMATSIRETCPGAIGGQKVAEFATDEEVLRLVNLHDQAALLHNRALAYETQKINIIKSILTRGIA